MVNQEKVWKREKHALEERKKLDELKRERDQERELQELRRLQEEAGGKKRQDRVDWMYAAPTQGEGANPDEMEEYLLGKKKIDKILRGDEAQQLSAVGGQVGPAATSSREPQGYQALQNANTAQDLAAKVREDPMLAIKKQEQSLYEALLRDPTRLRQLRKQHGLQDGKSEDRERPHAERSARHRRRHDSGSRHDKEERHRHRSHRHSSHRNDPRSRSPNPSRHHERDGHRSSRHHHDDHPLRRETLLSVRADDYSSRVGPPRRHSRQDAKERQEDYGRDHNRWEGNRRDDDSRLSGHSSRRSDYISHREEFPQHDNRPSGWRRERDDRSIDNGSSRRERGPGARGACPDEERAAKVAAMAAAAQVVDTTRGKRVAADVAADKAEEEREGQLREQLRKRYGAHASDEVVRRELLLSHQKVLDPAMDLQQSLKRQRRGLQRLEE